ncbi:MAG TPA: ferrochelatase [Myxococcota bacterium]|nr:ferrochelatase [Myxococcota bacterium]
MSTTPIGVLLVQLGTPDAPTPPALRRYLGEFLSDPRVIDLPAPLRWLLLHGVILRRRPRASAEAYAKIWTPSGSPLRIHSDAFTRALARELGAGYAVALGMRYGEPRIDTALAALAGAGATRLLVWPLFPQYAEASSGSALARVFECLRHYASFGRVRALGPCFDDPGFADAWAAVARPALETARPEHVLFSYHGIPERQLRAADPTGRHCLASERCCDELSAQNAHAPSAQSARCYRAQCFATTRALAASIGLSDGSTSTSFQSRLGRARWTGPSTEHELARLRRNGVRRLAVLCPSFVADCLETLEEIGLRAREHWRAQGGEELVLVPSLNAHPRWIDAAARLVGAAAHGLDSDAPAASPEASESATPIPIT